MRLGLCQRPTSNPARFAARRAAAPGGNPTHPVERMEASEAAEHGGCTPKVKNSSEDEHNEETEVGNYERWVQPAVRAGALTDVEPSALSNLMSDAGLFQVGPNYVVHLGAALKALRQSLSQANGPTSKPCRKSDS